MITKEETYTQIELLENGFVQLRKTTKIKEDGIIISRNHHRHIRTPNDTLDDLPAHISSSINEFWCDEVLENFYNLASGSI